MIRVEDATFWLSMYSVFRSRASFPGSQLCVGGITCICLAGGGFPHFSVWMGLRSRRVMIVGWKPGEHIQEALVTAVPEQALPARIISQGIIVHPCWGGQSAGKVSRRLPQKRKDMPEHKPGWQCPDGALLQPIRSRAELLQEGAFEDRQAAQKEMFEYAEVYYNTKRRHSALGYQSPVNYEKNC